MLTPATLARASARFSSGNLPISSALNASDTPTLLLLISIASRRLFLIPVTTISSTSSSELSASSSAETKAIGKSNSKDNKYLFTEFSPYNYKNVFIRQHCKKNVKN